MEDLIPKTLSTLAFSWHCCSSRTIELLLCLRLSFGGSFCSISSSEPSETSLSSGDDHSWRVSWARGQGSDNTWKVSSVFRLSSELHLEYLGRSRKYFYTQGGQVINCFNPSDRQANIRAVLLSVLLSLACVMLPNDTKLCAA